MNPRTIRHIALFFSLALSPTYFVAAQECPSLLVNGDFSNTSGGFTSQYVLSNYLIEGQYAITKNASTLNPYFINLPDHSPSGNTNYLAVNGDANKTISAWKSVVTLKKGVTYEFSFRIANLHKEFQKANPDTINSAQPAKIQYVIDDQPLIKVNTWPDNQWRHYVQLYTATRDVTTTLVLRNNANPAPVGGNDFALDDIVFREVCITTGENAAFAPEEVFSVYPNPIKSGTLHFGKKANAFSLLSTDNTEVLHGTNSEFLSTDGLAKGLYFLRLDDKIFKILVE